MTLQSLNLITIASWLTLGCLNQLTNATIINLLYAVITWIVIFVLSGTSLAYVYFRRNEKIVIVSDTVLLFSVGILVSIFFIPLIILLTSTKLPINNSLALALMYIFFLLTPYLKPKLEILSKLRLHHLYHPLTICALIIFLLQALSLSQFHFLPGLDTYSWLIAYENTLDYKLYNTAAGINRILFSTIVGVSHQLSDLSYYNLFKYWFPFFSLLTIFPLWLLARSIKNKKLQYIILLSSLTSPAIILDFGTTRHQIVLMLFLYLAIGILYAANKKGLKPIIWLTFLASFIGALYHPLFLILTVIWTLAVLGSNRKLLQGHPILSLSVIIIFYITLAKYFRLQQLLRDLSARFEPVLSNLISLNWNLQYPTHFVSESVEMGWAGITGVFKFYGFYHGPLTITILALLIFTAIRSKGIHKKLIQYLRNPYLLPLILFGTLLFSLGEILPRISPLAFLPDRSLTLFGIFTPLLLISLAQSHKTLFNNKIIITALLPSLILSIAGSLYVNQGISHTIPNYEFEAANWINENTPNNRYFFRSSSKNILRYYAKSKALRMPAETTTSNNIQQILSVINEQKEVFKNSNPYIYYAVTDPRNPYTQRPYESSFTGTRPNSSFPALSSHPEYFELIYHQPNQVYIWHIKDLAYE